MGGTLPLEGADWPSGARRRDVGSYGGADWMARARAPGGGYQLCGSGSSRCAPDVASAAGSAARGPGRCLPALSGKGARVRPRGRSGRRSPVGRQSRPLARGRARPGPEKRPGGVLGSGLVLTPGAALEPQGGRGLGGCRPEAFRGLGWAGGGGRCRTALPSRRTPAAPTCSSCRRAGRGGKREREPRQDRAAAQAAVTNLRTLKPTD